MGDRLLIRVYGFDKNVVKKFMNYFSATLRQDRVIDYDNELGSSCTEDEQMIVLVSECSSDERAKAAIKGLLSEYSPCQIFIIGCACYRGLSKIAQENEIAFVDINAWDDYTKKQIEFMLQTIRESWGNKALTTKVFSLFNVLDTAVSLLLSDRGGEQGTSSKLGGERVYIGIDPKKLDNLTKTVSDIVGEGLFK